MTRSPRRWARGTGGNLSRGDASPTRRDLSVPGRDPSHRRAHARAGGAHGAVGTLGQLLQPQGGAAMTRPFRRGIFSRIALEVALGGDRPSDVLHGRIRLRGAWRRRNARRLALIGAARACVREALVNFNALSRAPASCPATPSAPSSPSPLSASRTARPSAASSTAARRASRFPRRTSSPTSTAASREPRGT